MQEKNQISHFLLLSYYRKNSKRIKSYQKEYYQNHLEEQRKHNREYYRENCERIKQHQKEYHLRKSQKPSMLNEFALL